MRRGNRSWHESLRANSSARTKESVREIRHVISTSMRKRCLALQHCPPTGHTRPTFVLDTSPQRIR